LKGGFAALQIWRGAALLPNVGNGFVPLFAVTTHIASASRETFDGREKTPKRGFSLIHVPWV